jgi:hypothetical protein
VENISQRADAVSYIGYTQPPRPPWACTINSDPKHIEFPHLPSNPSGQHPNLTMEHPFWGSPAFFFLSAIIFELTYLAIYLTCRTDALAAAGGFVVCNLFICLSLFAYARSLYWSANFPAWFAFRCMAQAVISGLLLAIPIAIAAFEVFEPWGYFLLVWAITLLVNVAYDFCFMGLWWMRLPVGRFMTR